MEWSQKLKNTAIELMKGKPTSRQMMFKIPANNPPDFWKVLRHDYGITVLKEKVKGKHHYIFWIPRCDFPKVRKWLACATNTSKPIQNIKKHTKPFNNIEDNHVKHN